MEVQDLRSFRSELSLANKAGRVFWHGVWLTLFRPSPRPAHAWRRLLLQAFGAKIGARARVYSSARIWAPWNLELGDRAVLGDHVDCYSVAKIRIGADAIVSQYAHLCAATHDHRQPHFPLQKKPITVGAGAWVAAGAFVGPGVKVGRGAVVAARACVVKEVAAGDIVGGNPAKAIGKRSAEQLGGGEET